MIFKTCVFIFAAFVIEIFFTWKTFRLSRMASKNKNNKTAKNNAKAASKAENGTKVEAKSNGGNKTKTQAKAKAKSLNGSASKAKNSMADKLNGMNMGVKIPSFKIQDYIRVLKLARKPTREEFTMISKISILGIALIGMIGFIIYVFLTELPKAF